MNAALLTGESRPVQVAAGDAVYAGTLNVSAPARVLVTQAGEASRVAQLLQQVEASAGRRAPVVLAADRLAAWFVGAGAGAGRPHLRLEGAAPAPRRRSTT